MPTRKQEEKFGNNFITYIGRTSKGKHGYILGNRERDLLFGRKLQRYHRIGKSYPVNANVIDKSSGQIEVSTRHLDLEIEAPIVIAKQELAMWVMTDGEFANLEKADKERKSLEAEARKKARELKSMYQRAQLSGKMDIIRAFVEELEK